MSFFVAGDWPVSYAGTGCSLFGEEGDPELQDGAEEMAVGLLWNWTNRLLSTRTELIRPQRVRTPWRPTTFEGMGPAAAYYNLGEFIGFGWLPAYGIAGEWLELSCGRCGSIVCDCDGNALKAINLLGPVQEIVEIKIDGVVLNPSTYRVDNGHTLIRQDGNPWPDQQDLYLALTEVGTWSIEYTRGVPVPLGGQLAAGLLACELAKAMNQDPDCALPSRVSSITRQGVSMEIVQTQFARANSEQETWTGIFAIDSWIASFNTPRPFASVAFPGSKPNGTKEPYNLGYLR